MILDRVRLASFEARQVYQVSQSGEIFYESFAHDADVEVADADVFLGWAVYGRIHEDRQKLLVHVAGDTLPRWAAQSIVVFLSSALKLVNGAMGTKDK